MKWFWRLLIIAALPVAASAQTRVDSAAKMWRFPILLVDTAVSNRLAEEWEPNNRYQHERAYCIAYTTELRPGDVFDPPLVVYKLTKVARAIESITSPNGIQNIQCPMNWSFVVQGHTHPPTECAEMDEGASCHIGGEYSQQCFASPADWYTLQASDDPFEIIQCDRRALVPVWRKSVAPQGR